MWAASSHWGTHGLGYLGIGSSTDIEFNTLLYLSRLLLDAQYSREMPLWTRPLLAA